MALHDLVLNLDIKSDMYEIDEQQIRLWWQVFNPQNKLVEIRLLGKVTFSGYFKSIDTLLSQLRPLLAHENYNYYGALQAYFTLNELNDSLYSREQRDIFVKKPKSTSTDSDVIRRRMIMLDFDACRVASVSASDEEYEKAHIKAVEVYKYLIEQGFKEPIVSTSGNGYHCYLPCDMPNDEEHTELIKRFLKSLGSMFSDNSVELDEVVYNAARVDKVAGTWAKKGSDSEERRWRLARILKVPKDLSPNDESLFQKIADLLPKEEPKTAPNRQRPNYNGTQFDLRSWLARYGIVYREEVSGTSTKFVLQQCPWIDEHSDRKKWDSALFLAPDGQITFNCQHNHCKGRTWFDFRKIYEPNAYDRPIYQPQYAPRQYAPQKPKYQIKEEIPELGEKWKSLSSIKRADLSNFEKVKTGFTELDRRISGLFMSEVTVLSGSNASGKSSWLNTLIHNIIEQNFKVALWSGEMRDDILKTWIHMPAAGKRNMLRSKYEDNRYYVPDSVAEKIDAWLDGKFFLYNNNYGTNAEQILSDMEILERAGVKVFILDNMMAMDIDLFEGDKNSKQKELILRIKDFAKTKMVHIILVAHPRKAVAFLRKTDISGTGDIINAVDNCFIMHRTNEDFLHAVKDFYNSAVSSQLGVFGNVLCVEKNRMFGVVDYFCGMYFEVESRRFKNTIDEDIHYGWEDIGGQGEMFQDTSEPFESTNDEESDDPF